MAIMDKVEEDSLSSSTSSSKGKEKISFDEFEEIDVSKEGIVALLYGDTGCGKSYTSLTFPEPIIAIDTEDRLDRTKKLFPGKKIKVFRICELKQSLDKEMDDVLDEHGTINNASEVISAYIYAVAEGKIKGGTIVIDSITDMWSFIQGWMFYKLSKMRTKDGRAKADDDMRTVLDQRDWKIANNKHDGIIKILRSLTKHGVNVVFTAREKSVPEYATNTPQNKEKIRCQKDIPFSADVIFNLRKMNGKHYAVCEKLGITNTNVDPIENLTYEKIMKLKPLG